MKTGPSIDDLTHFLAECPPEFLAEPAAQSTEGIHVDAVVFDTLLRLGGTTSYKSMRLFEPGEQRNATNRITLVMCWLMSHPWFVDQGLADLTHKTLLELPGEIAPLVKPERLVDDPDRREELARLVLRRLGLVPKGETEAHAADRLKSISSVERKRLLEETRAQVEHAQRLRKAMAEKQAREAAARYTGE